MDDEEAPGVVQGGVATTHARATPTPPLAARGEGPRRHAPPRLWASRAPPLVSGAPPLGLWGASPLGSILVAVSPSPPSPRGPRPAPPLPPGASGTFLPSKARGPGLPPR